MKRATEEQRAYALKLYLEGKPLQLIVESVGFCQESILAWAKRANVLRRPRANPEQKASALAMYEQGIFITEIAGRTGMGMTTIFRWAQEAGIVKPFSDRAAERFSKRPAGREHIGKKGVFHTAKGGGWIPTDSTYELARMEQLEADSDVVGIARCRDRIAYTFGERRRNYIPDFRVELRSGAVRIEEVKPERWVNDPKVQAKAEAARLHYAGRGTEFVLVTEQTIGRSFLKAFVPNGLSHASEDYRAAAKEKRREQRRVAQLAYTRRRNVKETPEALEKRREYMRAKMREYRANKKAVAP